MFFTNYNEHPTNSKYIVFFYKDVNQSNEFRKMLENDNIKYEYHRDGDQYYYAVDKYYRKKVIKYNYIAYAKYRKPTFNNKYISYSLLIFFIIVILILIFSIYKNS